MRVRLEAMKASSTSSESTHTGGFLEMLDWPLQKLEHRIGECDMGGDVSGTPIKSEECRCSH